MRDKVLENAAINHSFVSCLISHCGKWKEVKLL